jgi:hypothetical protein
MNHVILHFDVIKRLREPLGRVALGLLTKEMLEEGDFGSYFVIETDITRIAMLTHATSNRKVHVDDESAKRIATGFSSVFNLMLTEKLPMGPEETLESVSCKWISPRGSNQRSAAQLIEKKVISENGEESPQHLSVTSIDGREFSHSPQIDDFIFSSTVWSMAQKNSCTVVASEISHVWELLHSKSDTQVQTSIALKPFSEYVERARQGETRVTTSL